MRIYIVDKKGVMKLCNVSRDKVIVAALEEVLRAHDYLYRMNWKGTTAKPSWDIAAKNARRVCMALRRGESLPNITIESEYLVKTKKPCKKTGQGGKR